MDDISSSVGDKIVFILIQPETNCGCIQNCKTEIVYLASYKTVKLKLSTSPAIKSGLPMTLNQIYLYVYLLSCESHFGFDQYTILFCVRIKVSARFIETSF